MTSASFAPDLVTYQHYIGGNWVAPISQRHFPSVNPTTNEPWADIADGTPEDVDRAVDAARQAFESEAWRNLSPTKRGRLLMKVGDAIAERAEEIAAVETRDNGKLYKETLGQLQALPNWYYYFGGLADKAEGRVIPLDRQSVLNYTLREPLGVVGAITPWNSPIFLTSFKLAPALAAGNTVVVKPSEYASASILEMAPIFTEAGFPPGSVNIVTGKGDTGAALAQHAGVAKIAFTGSTETGRRVAMGAISHLARVTLELGGKSPNIVFADADLDAAEAGVLSGIFAASGQTCIAGSRAFVARPIYDAFLERLVARARTIRLGNPMDPEIQMGPASMPAQLRKIEQYVEIARTEGADVLVGGSRPTNEALARGLFYEPTILGNVRNDMRVAQEEIFGPVLSIIPFDDEADVVRQANDVEYGLAAGIWTRDIKRAHRMARALEVGIVWINTYRSVAFNSPFGGYKGSGIGRENGLEALQEYTQEKSVWVELSDEIADPFVLKT